MLSVQLPSGDVDVDANLSAPEVPSVDAKKPKKGLFGSMFGGSKGKLEASRCL